MQARKAYPSDVSDEHWKIIGPLIPPPKAGGAPAKFALREVLNGILWRGADDGHRGLPKIPIGIVFDDVAVVLTHAIPSRCIGLLSGSVI